MIPALPGKHPAEEERERRWIAVGGGREERRGEGGGEGGGKGGEAEGEWVERWRRRGEGREMELLILKVLHQNKCVESAMQLYVE